ncbi:CPBP family intramembrane glutamic endopeptidase [Micromonospora sp. RP3T]|uniref:CPBP family intramembrane glutamic endopeptidase n=1 Tax=Micromonospora sp. RP3T TaxID=2135446 RepID=UPI000D173AA7|nr:type II CAAX endopeptidase family protein [Micromonospora sp. RP3T]PTA47437.1 CPBP family intramembrane metalloprotease domain-containing protein [Micromonospora sp. RP3T]
MSHRVRGIVVFLAIAFGGTWPYLFLARSVLGWSLVDPLVQLPVAMMPAIGAVVVRRWVTREGFADAGLRLRLRSAWRHWLIAWFAPLAVTFLAFGCAAASGWWRPDLSPVGGPGGVALLLILQLVTTPVYWGEEFGWTSFLWPRLLPGRPRASVLATGLVWAVWHYPLAYLGYAEFPDHTVSMALWTLMFVLFQVMLCWLYARTGSVWATSLAHAGNNMVAGLLVERVFGELGAVRNMICVDVALALVCVPLLCSAAFRPRPVGSATPGRRGC